MKNFLKTTDTVSLRRDFFVYNKSMIKQIGVLGAGTFGIALARMLANDNYDVMVFSPTGSNLEQLQKERVHKNLPGVSIPESIVFTRDIKEVCEGKQLLLFAVPSIYVREITAKAKDYINEDTIIVDVAKGIEADTLLTMSQVIKDELKNDRIRVVALSGPTHAEEVARDLPSTIVSACEDEKTARIVQDVFMNTCMIVYTNKDVLGVELCGAMKNIIALAAGISAGLGYGDNAKAAIITRGMVEITRLGLKMGADKDTFPGLAGIGDLIVTATSVHSRNNKCGMLIGQGLKPKDAIEEVGMVVEGINALPAAMKLMREYQIEMPITAMVNAIVNEKIGPKSAVAALMMRDKKNENNY